MIGALDMTHDLRVEWLDATTEDMIELEQSTILLRRDPPQSE